MPSVQTISLRDIPVTYQPLMRSAARNLAEEFSGHFGVETIERYLAESFDELLARSRIDAFVPLFAERFARDRLWSLARVEGKVESGVPVVLFLCVQNAGRSQMAAGFAESLGGERLRVMSGGSEPGEEVNPNAVAAMEEIGIDIARQFPKPWTDEVVQAADVVITMGCGDACPIFPGTRYEDWAFEDPADTDLAGVRTIRDAIEARVRQLLLSLDVEPAS